MERERWDQLYRLAIVMLLALPAVEARAGLADSHSWQQVSDDGQYLLVMVATSQSELDGKWRWQLEERLRIRATYKESGLYRNDGSTEPLWTFPRWSSGTAFILPDGKHVVLAQESWRHSYQHVVRFYSSGKVIATYDYFDLEPYYHWSWRVLGAAECRDWQLDSVARTVTLRTTQGETFVFDVTTGKIIRRSSPYPKYVALGGGFVLVLMGAVGFWFFRRKRVIGEPLES